jgi:hypothetical protein
MDVSLFTPIGFELSLQPFSRLSCWSQFWSQLLVVSWRTLTSAGAADQQFPYVDGRRRTWVRLARNE